MKRAHHLRLALVLTFASLAGCGKPEVPVTDLKSNQSEERWDVEEMTLADAQAKLASGQITARELTEAYLQRIAQMDRSGWRLNAMIEQNSRALADADRLDAERRAGKTRGPLHGIPVLLKDNIDVAGMVNSAGAAALADNRPKTDAFLVQRLREAGVVILGKTNLSEWANFRSTHSISGWSSRGGQTRNPYVLDRNPCGSSSGTASAIAASFAMVGVGTETDGSIICPASVNGLVGLKPTVGLVSRSGIIPISTSQDTAGPMGRSVADVAALLTAMTAVDVNDSAAQSRIVPESQDYLGALHAADLNGARIGILRQAMGYLPAVDAQAENDFRALRVAGATLIDIELDTWGRWDDAELEVLLYEFKDGVNRYLAGGNSAMKSLADVIAWNNAHSPEAMPWFGQELLVMAEAKGPLTDPKYLKARDDARRWAGKDGLLAAMDAHQLDAVIAPSNAPAWLTDTVLGDHYVGGGYSVAAVAGTPSITVPSGETQGLPLGLVFMGRHYSEARLIGLAYAFEQATRARRKPSYRTSLAMP
jgi:amidase